jgi:hypothetical protein
VPVDWVSAVMTRIIGDESLHGRTYHLTSDVPTDVATLCRVFEGLVGELAAVRRPGLADGAAAQRAEAFIRLGPETLGRLFLDQMDVYRAYWRDDPVFDATNTRRAVPDLPAPPLDEPALRRLCRFAIANDFRWPPPGRAARTGSARTLLERLLGGARWAAPPSAGVGLAAIGGGGGQWTIGLDAGRPTSRHGGLPRRAAPTAWVGADTLAELLTGQATVAAAAAGGRLVAEPEAAVVHDVLETLAGSSPAEAGEGAGGDARQFDRSARREIPADEA